MVEPNESGSVLDAIKRTPTGVAGLDAILTGGFLSRATHLVAGPSGTGKTLLAQQVSFHNAKAGAQVLYLTLLSESHEKMISNTASFSFFNRQLIGTAIQYLSVYQDVVNGGLNSLVAVSREAVLKHRAKLVVLDGISSLRDFATSRGDLRKTLFDFNTQMSVLGCTVLMLVDDELSPQNAPEYAIADSIIRLHNQTWKRRHIRSLEVVKSRATAALPGLHYFQITGDGLKIFPRTEALLAGQIQAPPPALSLERAKIGVEGLDNLLDGGLLRGSISVALGTPGSGKSTTGWRFIYEGALQGERGLILSFHQSLDQIAAISAQLGYDLAPFIRDGRVRVLWLLPLEQPLDQAVGELISTMQEFGPSRLFIDSLTELENMATHTEELTGFWSALTNWLRNQQITTLGAMDMHRLAGNFDIPERSISAIADTMILLRGTEIEGQVRRSIAVLEMRGSRHDTSVCEYLISEKGLAVGKPLRGLDKILGNGNGVHLH